MSSMKELNLMKRQKKNLIKEIKRTYFEMIEWKNRKIDVVLIRKYNEALITLNTEIVLMELKLEKDGIIKGFLY